MVGNGVLIANGLCDVAEDLRELGLKSREVRHSTGHLGEGGHLVVGLKVVEPCDRTHGTPSIVIFAHCSAGSDGIDSDVLRILYFVKNLVVCQLAESIHAAGNQDDVLPALN